MLVIFLEPSIETFSGIEIFGMFAQSAGFPSMVIPFAYISNLFENPL